MPYQPHVRLRAVLLAVPRERTGGRGRATDDTNLVLTFKEAIGADATSRYEAVCVEDRDRVRLWSGEPIDPTDRADTMPLFLRSVVYRVAPQDPTLLRAVCRRIELLDPIHALATNPELLDRAKKLLTSSRPPRQRRARTSSPRSDAPRPRT